MACNKDKDETQYVDGMVIWAGEKEVDGCEWMIVIENNYYKPSNLSKDFEIANLQVSLTYENDTVFKYYCGDMPISQKAIKVLQIKKK